jgi:hypothetical protein
LLLYSTPGPGFTFFFHHNLTVSSLVCLSHAAQVRDDGVQLRRLHRRGGQVPRPPQQQHNADGRQGVAPAHHAPELLVRLLLIRRQRQVRVRAFDTRQLVQVPPPPHQLPGPRPRTRCSVPAGRRAAPGRPVLRLLPHRRGAVRRGRRCSQPLRNRPTMKTTGATSRGRERENRRLSCQMKGAY